MQQIKDIGPADVDRLLNLNNAHARETSLLDKSSLCELLRMAFYSRGIDRGSQAVLLALDQNAPYNNPNFDWFKRRNGTFIYIDRVIVAQSSRGLGLARRLYLDLADRAQEAGHIRIVCEVNIDPPNPDSDGFHLAMGFITVGEASIHDNTKKVRYLEGNPARILEIGSGYNSGVRSP